ncbi:cyclic nucleotide-binding domain protein (macronuclear) [Tetrahymena thermophila SB210]|uniref:Cyclic nucleotide-binding domain protein n=1 Tax=Tetrahymena thermophila (strain SB210) TaxID=312017 RepID=I7LUF3_TETTS|nr:cyclic nucleotide-binding domain protein [Tetrahymena thermophila SB210]EAR92941.2 cyclic nucleotide-binding domain protein [Tetrahymena thermophila SB210]|eukprot:XP_001013186.2 cyclic nucleotide-binding domain protein [Tetrahymena thermophila SB210]
MNREEFTGLGDEEAILPPGMEKISTTVYGYLTITIDDILYLNSGQYPQDQVRIRAEFWGDSKPGKIFRARNSSISLCDMYPCSRTYKICCQMEQFYKYLEDMSKSKQLKMMITDNVNKKIGYFKINFLPYLKPSLGFSDHCPFDEIENVYPILSFKKDQEKIGEIKVIIDSSFDPNKSQFIHQFSGNNTVEIDQKNLQFQNIQQQNEDFSHYQENQPSMDRNLYNSSQNEFLNINNQFDQRVPLSLIEKKQQLEYQANKFLENIPKKVNLGLELMEEIYNDDDEEDVQAFPSQQKNNQEMQIRQFDQNHNKERLNENMQYSNQNNVSNQREDYRLFPQNQQEQQQRAANNPNQRPFIQKMEQIQQTTFQNQNFFVDQENINQKLDKILELGENIFQMKKDLKQQAQNSNESNNIIKKNDPQLKSNHNENNFSMDKVVSLASQKIQTAQFDNSNDISNNSSQSDFLKDEIERQKQIIREQNSANNSSNSGLLLGKLSFKKRQDESNVKRQQIKSDQLVEYNLPKVNEINKAFNDEPQVPYDQAQHAEKETQLLKKNENIEEIKQSESLELNILEFNCLHEHLLTKFKQRNIFIGCQIPSILKHPSQLSESIQIEDSLKTFCKEVNGEEFIFRQKFTLSIEINDENYEKINNSSIQFTLNSFILPQKEVQDQKRIMMQIASGEFKISKLLEQKSLSGNFYINMWTSIPVNQHKQDCQEEAAKLIKIPKQDLEINKKENLNLLGQVKISIQLILKRKYNKQGAISQQQHSFNFNKTGASIASSQVDQGLSYSQHIASTIFNNFQILLRLGKLKILNLQSYSAFNFFSRYKIYGTIEQVSSEIQWENSEPDLHHRLTIPCSLENIQKMLKIPFIIEIWNKSDKGDDQIVGIIKINMSSIPKTILLPDFTGVNPNFIQPQQSQLLIVCNENVTISDIADNKDKGLLFVTIAFGSPIQLSKFDTNLQQSHIDYQHSIHQRSQQNSSFYTNNSLKPPLIANKNMNFNVEQQNLQQHHNRQQNLMHQGITQTINVSSIYDKNKQFSSAQKNQSQQLNQTESLQFKSEDRRVRQQIDMEYDDEDIRQHSLTIKPESHILQSNRQKKFEEEYEMEACQNTNLIEKFIDILQILNQNMNKIQQNLKKFILSFQAKDEIQNKEFIEFLQSLDLGIKLADIVPLIKILDYKQQGSFKFEFFSKSFNSFQRYENQIKQKYQLILQKLLEVIEASNIKPSDIDKELIRQSEFGLMRKEKFVSIMKKLNLAGDNVYELVESICSLLDVKNDGLLFVSTLNDYLQSIDVYGEIKKLILNPLWFFEIVQQEFSHSLLTTNKEDAKKLEKQQLFFQKEKIQYDELINFFDQDQSFWEVLLLICIIKGKKEIYQKEELAINGEQLKIFLNALKFQAQSDQQSNSSSKQINNLNEKKGALYEYSSSKKKQTIEINNQYQNDLSSNYSQIQASQIKKSSVQKIQEQQELDLITNLLNNEEIKLDLPTSKSNQQNKSNYKKGEFEDEDETENIPIYDNYNSINSNQKEQQKYTNNLFEKQEKLSSLGSKKTKEENGNQNIQQSINNMNKELNASNSNSQILQKKKFKVVHKFIVNIHKILITNLGKEYDMENAVLLYQFGDSEKVQIGSFDYFYGQSRYDINYQGEKIYKLNNEEDLDNILIQENIGIKMDLEISNQKLNTLQNNFGMRGGSNQQNKLKFTANLSSFVLLDIIQSSQLQKNEKQNDLKEGSQPFIIDQSINLVDNITQQYIGKIQLTIQYFSKEQVVEIENLEKSNLAANKNNQRVEECLLEKETKVKKLLPKSGFFNISINAVCSLKQNEIDCKNYKIMLFCDFFHENPYLSSIFKSLNSQAIYNQTEEILTIQESYQINLNQEIINYLQENTCLIQLRIFPLDDLIKRSNFIILAEQLLNLQYLLINQEINEESLVLKRKEIVLDKQQSLKNESEVINKLPISTQKEIIGVCSVEISYLKEKKLFQSNQSLTQFQKQIKNTSSLNQNNIKESAKNNYHQVFVLFDELLSLIMFENLLVTDQMCYFRTKINGKIIDGKGSFKMNFIENRIQELSKDSYIQFLLESEELDTINPLNIELVVRDMNKSQGEEIVLGHISIDFEILRKEFFQNLLENNSMKCTNSLCFTLLKRDRDNQVILDNGRSIEQQIMSIRVNLRLLLVKYETKGDYEQCQQFLQSMINSKQNLSIDSNNSSDILDQLRLSIRYTRQDFDSILSYLLFDKNTLYALLNLSDNQKSKCLLSQNECQQLLEDVFIYDKNENGIIEMEDLKKVLRKYSNQLKEQAEVIINKLDRNYTKILNEIIGNNLQKLDYIYFFKKFNILNQIQDSLDQSILKYQLKLTIQKATNVGVLFNGVIPNTYIKCIQLDISTNCILRDSNPQFDHCYEIELHPNQFKNYHQIKFMLYHRGYNQDFRDNMYKSTELGSAILDLSKMFFTKIKDLNKEETFKIKIESAHYSARIQNEAYLFVNVQLNCLNQFQQAKIEYQDAYTQNQQIYSYGEEEKDLNKFYKNTQSNFMQETNHEDDLIYNDEAFNNFKQTLMELREQNQEEDQQDEKIYQEIETKENFQTIPKNIQFSQGFLQKPLQDEIKFSSSENKKLQAEQNDCSDIMLEKAMNEIDDLTKLLESEKDQDKYYENIYRQQDKDQQNAIQNPQFIKEKPTQIKDSMRRDVYNSEDELEDLRKTLQQMNEHSENQQSQYNDYILQKSSEDDLKAKLSSNQQHKQTNNIDTSHQYEHSYLRNNFQSDNSQYKLQEQLKRNSNLMQEQEEKYPYYSKYMNYLGNQGSKSDQNKQKEGGLNIQQTFELEKDKNILFDKQKFQKQFKQSQYSEENSADKSLSKNNSYSNDKLNNYQIENLKQTRNELKNYFTLENYETFKPAEYQQDKQQSQYNSVGRPPIKKSDSQNSLKKLENKILPKYMKDSAEINRISNIMKQDFSKQKKYFDNTSDSEDD